MEQPSSKTKRLSDTYVITRTYKDEELERLIGQDTLFTQGMGGILPEQEDPHRFKRVLDIGCGPGGWLIEAAQAYPSMTELVGVDINAHFVAYANEQAKAHQDRLRFHVMDATLMLEFPDAAFDLVTMRLGSSFLRTWDWPKVLSEMARVTQTGGTIRLVDAEIAPRTNSEALNEFFTLMVNAFHQSGHLFDPVPNSLTDHLESLVHQHTNSQDTHTKLTTLEHRGGTPEGLHYYEDIKRLVLTIRPFLQKWGCAPANFDQLSQQALSAMQQSDFVGTVTIKTVWATKHHTNQRPNHDTPS